MKYQAVMEAVGDIVPELDELRHKAKARPLRRARNRLAGKARIKLRDPRLQVRAARQGPRLL